MKHLKTLILLLLLIFPTIGYSLDVGDRAPDFNATTLDGKKIAYFSSLKGKKPVYLIFWATW